ncbi:hypothetical protein B0H67DRAFT_593650 [Lasiosphaeris hirsuta]|uniref:Uncharacterized protein n=1 Tax=Lasiosphaeris hirsuta TaxID=260670 RepID=A0AA40DIW5_9PEZI|nr:hypothetical protein B0H67DRAFT_593650 [Lasiosphaeris hirsuta]
MALLRYRAIAFVFMLGPAGDKGCQWVLLPLPPSPLGWWSVGMDARRDHLPPEHLPQICSSSSTIVPLSFASDGRDLWLWLQSGPASSHSINLPFF